MPNQYRALWHDYRSKCIYMITLVKVPGTEPFGRLRGKSSIPFGEFGSPYVEASFIGIAIKKTLRRLPLIEPAIQLLQYALMPDHLHILIAVTETTADLLGQIIARFKIAANAEAGKPVFAPGFNDQILTNRRSLDVLFRYLRDNPRRLAVRRERPEFFTQVNRLEIGGRVCQAYGNMHLLANPFKEAVVVHRRYTTAELKEKTDLWLYTAANRGVLVSPFISPKEKEVRAQAEALGAKIILISDRPMPERYKPAEHDFSLCTLGRQLIVSIASEAPALSRSTCVAMNSLASEIAYTS